MDSDLHHQQQTQYNNNQQQQQQIQQPQPTMNLGLTRYRSAPSSYFSNLINSNIMYGDDEISQITDTDMNQVVGFEKQLMDVIKQEESQLLYQDSQAVYQSQKEDQFQCQTGQNSRPVSLSSSTVVDTSTTMNMSTNMSMNNMNNNLVRQSSSPAGFFANLDIDNGYPMMRSMDDYRVGGGNSSNSLLTSTKRFKNETSFSSGSGLLPRIPENDAKVMEMKGELIDGGFGSNSWDDSDILSDSFLKEFGESDQNKQSSLNSSEYQRNNVERIRGPSSLIHHLSLPASTAELDKLMQFQDSVPLRSRAKRGCATHPRSIAERVRRTRISERMRKLQDLVPNMDKQTNTADMLDLAVDYIKVLQKEAETLSEHHAKCTCPHKQKL